ncbi:restriction endonuclease [Bacteroidota bacterium]
MKKGELFEAVVDIVHQALRDNPNTTIHRRHKLENTSGAKREIDVLIKSKLNGMDINIAIECKNHNRKTSVNHIESFKAKCDRIPAINKRIFVSKLGYQSDAINAAREFGIELHTLEEFTSQQVSNWLSTSIFHPVEISPSALGLSVKFLENAPDIKIQVTDFILLPNKEKISIERLIQISVNHHMSSFGKVSFNPKQPDNSEVFEFSIPAKGCVLEHGVEQYKIQELIAIVKYDYRINESLLTINSYDSDGSDGRKLQTATLSMINGGSLTVIENKKGREFDIFSSDKKKSQLYCTIKVEDKKTQK